MFIKKIVYLIIILCILCSCAERGENNVNQSYVFRSGHPEGLINPISNISFDNGKIYIANNERAVEYANGEKKET